MNIIVIILFSIQEYWPIEHVEECKKEGKENDEDVINEGKLISMPVARFYRSKMFK